MTATARARFIFTIYDGMWKKIHINLVRISKKKKLRAGKTSFKIFARCCHE